MFMNGAGKETELYGELSSHKISLFRPIFRKKCARSKITWPFLDVCWGSVHLHEENIVGEELVLRYDAVHNLDG